MTLKKERKYEAIVLGTSAGGLQTLSAILKDLPAEFSLPIIVVQHRSKDQRNLLEEILQYRCKIQIKQADEKEKIKRGVYIAPADYHLLIESDKTFSLSSDEQVKYSRPSIDVLFESAATVYNDKLVGIILSGASSDGSEGISAIKKSGGFTIAQTPEEALYSLMPKASIETKNIDQIMNLSEIKNFLIKINGK